MNKIFLESEIKRKQSILCVGLDTDIAKIPSHLLKYNNPIEVFNKEIIEATSDICVAYKPNIAFYEAQGLEGWQALESTLNHIPSNIFTIADAKRGDIGNTSTMYAKAFFQNMSFDSVTVAPYMGKDSVAPFLEFEDKWAIVLGLTSNMGSGDFQYILDSNKIPLYKTVIMKAASWGNDQNMMFVVGATHPEELKEIRAIIPHHFLLIPGIGAQGGDLEGTLKNGLVQGGGLLINSARSIIYASNGLDYAVKAREAAQEFNQQILPFLKPFI